jgi:hypothetical protein
VILIELNGERQLVESLDGYDGCTVVAEGVDAPPSDHCQFVDGAWLEDEDARAEAEWLGSTVRRGCSSPI